MPGRPAVRADQKKAVIAIPTPCVLSKVDVELGPDAENERNQIKSGNGVGLSKN